MNKSSQQKCFFAHKAFTLQIRQNHGLQTVAQLRSLKSQASVNICYAPATTQTTIVLPDFVRSLSADRGGIEFINIGESPDHHVITTSLHAIARRNDVAIPD